ncbi:DUF1093 domain-containing protein, partial [Bacillus sp. SS-TM]
MEVTFTVSKWDEKPIDDTRKDYEYKLIGFDKDGKEKELEFTAQK